MDCQTVENREKESEEVTGLWKSEGSLVELC